jgi:hypothetical protein
MEPKSDDQPNIDPRIRCFERQEDARAFDTAITQLMSAIQKQARQLLVDERNVLRFNHGNRWVHTAREHGDKESTMHTISVEHTIPFKGIAENDLGLIEKSILPISESMERQFAQDIYGVVGAGAERVGNVVDARQNSIPESFLTMLRKIEFGVDREGNVSLPQVHLGPDLHDRFMTELNSQPPEFGEEVERIKAEKSKVALAREAERKAKFKRRPS